MGPQQSLLDTPDKTKHSENPTTKNKKVLVGVCSMQGWRASQEDAHLFDEFELNDGTPL